VVNAGVCSRAWGRAGPFFALLRLATKHPNSRRLDCGTESNKGVYSGAVCTNEASQIPASYFAKATKDKKAGTTKRVLAGLRFGAMRGFRNGLLRSSGANPELRTQKSRKSASRMTRTKEKAAGGRGCVWWGGFTR